MHIGVDALHLDYCPLPEDSGSDLITRHSPANLPKPDREQAGSSRHILLIYIEVWRRQEERSCNPHTMAGVGGTESTYSTLTFAPGHRLCSPPGVHLKVTHRRTCACPGVPVQCSVFVYRFAVCNLHSAGEECLIRKVVILLRP